MKVKVLITDCSKCRTTFDIVERVIKENNIEAELIRVDSLEEIMKYNIMSTPAIVIDEEVVHKGHIASEKQALEVLCKKKG